ncbi:hypothetical protein FWF89_01605 [Candidatus Saccharibacteria bacterium]|nr:hypothetical protein [Candidatus Saccharibacteria bacterium]
MIGMILKAMAAGISSPNLPCAPYEDPPGSGIMIDPCDMTGAGIVSAVLGWAYFAIGVVAAIIIVVAGIQYMTSEGEPERTKKAQQTITYTIIGLIIATAAAAIVMFVTGAFDDTRSPTGGGGSGGTSEDADDADDGDSGEKWEVPAR